MAIMPDEVDKAKMKWVHARMGSVFGPSGLNLCLIPVASSRYFQFQLSCRLALRMAKNLSQRVFAARLPTNPPGRDFESGLWTSIVQRHEPQWQNAVLFEWPFQPD